MGTIEIITTTIINLIIYALIGYHYYIKGYKKGLIDGSHDMEEIINTMFQNQENEKS